MITLPLPLLALLSGLPSPQHTRLARIVTDAFPTTLRISPAAYTFRSFHPTLDPAPRPSYPLTFSSLDSTASPTEYTIHLVFNTGATVAAPFHLCLLHRGTLYPFLTLFSQDNNLFFIPRSLPLSVLTTNLPLVNDCFQHICPSLRLSWVPSPFPLSPEVQELLPIFQHPLSSPPDHSTLPLILCPSLPPFLFTTTTPGTREPFRTIDRPNFTPSPISLDPIFPTAQAPAPAPPLAASLPSLNTAYHLVILRGSSGTFALPLSNPEVTFDFRSRQTLSDSFLPNGTHTLTPVTTPTPSVIPAPSTTVSR